MAFTLSLKKSLYENKANSGSQEFGLNVNYNEVFQNERAERTLSLRRNRFFDPTKKSQSWSGRLEKSLSSEQIISILNDPTYSKIKDLNSLQSSEKSMVEAVSKNSEVWECFINTFEKINQFDQLEDAILIINSISFLFPYADEANQENVSNSLVISFSDLLENPKFIIPILLLISTFSKTSIFGRDSIICYGIHMQILSKITTTDSSLEKDDEIQMECQTILDIYSNPGIIEDDVIFESIDSLISLINTDKIIQIKTAYYCLSNLINRKSCVADILFEKNIYDIIINRLDNPDLTASSLQFINSLFHNLAKIDTKIVSNSLLPQLFKLLSENEYISEIFRILSNLIEKIPRTIFDFLTNDFIHSTISLSQTASATVKIEAAYFLATCIRYIQPDRLKSFLQNDDSVCINLLDEMIASGIKEVIMRCVDTLIRVILNLSNDQYVFVVISKLEESGIIKDLYILAEEENDSRLNQMIQDLLNKINRLCSEDDSK